MPELPAATAAQLAAQLAELGETFQRSLPQRVGEVELALRALGEDWDQAALRELADATHRLAGAAGTFGHPVLGATALRMEELTRRLARIFLKGPDGKRPVYGHDARMQTDAHFRDHLQFYEYFHGDTGRGVGASHQTGWTALIAKLLQPRRPTG